MKNKLTLLVLVLITSLASAQTFVPDSTFNSTGKKIFNFYNNIDRSYGSLQQADGKIVIVGLSEVLSTNSFELCFARFNINGAIDNTFGLNGVTKVSMGNQGSIGGQTPVVKQDAFGRFVAINCYGSGGLDMMVCRLDSSGNIDNTFNNTGKLTIDMTGTGSQPDMANAFDFDAEGNIYIAGATRTGGSPFDNDIAIIKVNTSGHLATSFDTDGKKLFNPSGMAEFGRAIKVQSDGKIVFGATSGGKMFVGRIDSTGAYDPTFNSTGYKQLTIASSTDLYCLSIDDLGRIVVAGTSSYTAAAIARLLPNGTLDPAFGTGGYRIYSVAGLTTTVTGLQLMSNGKIVFGGSVTNTSSGMNFYAARLDSTGTVDLSFNTTGYFQTAMGAGSQDDEANNLLVLSDGRIFINGTTIVSSAINEDISMLLLKPQNTSSGINHVDVNTIQTLYPNPANASIAVNCNKELILEIINVEGKTVLQQIVKMGITTINIKLLSEGIYFVREQGSINSIRFIKVN